MPDLEGKIALVTGASRGLGYAAAEALGGEGAHVIAVARTVGGLEELADAVEQKGGSITLVPLDLTDDGGVQRLCLSVHERWGKVDLWLHTAIHTPPMAPARAIASKDLSKSLSVNVEATARLISMVEPLLTASDAPQALHCLDPRAGEKFLGTYGATKAAQTALFDSWAAENAQIGPRIQGFAPLPMRTALRARFYPGENTDALAAPTDEAKRLVEMIRQA